MKKQIITTTLALSLGLGGAYSFAPLSAHAAEAEVVFEISADVSVQTNLIEKYEEAENMFSVDSVDLASVKSFYEQNFQTLVQQRNPKIDESLSTILTAGVNGQASTGQVKEAIEKGLQWFFYDEINHFAREAGNALKDGNKALASENLDKAIALFEGSVYELAGRYEGDLALQTFFKNTVIPGLQAAVTNGDATDYTVFRQYFQKTMMKLFVLGTTKYATQVPKDIAEGNPEKAKVHMAEGYFFFMPIHEYYSGGSKEAADYVKNAFQSGDASQINTEKIKTALVQAVSAKVNEYVGEAAVADLGSGNLDKARVHAAEANAFLSQIEVIVKERLGADVWAELDSHATLFNKAVTAGDEKAAIKHGFPIVKKLSEITGVNFEIGGNTLHVNGEAIVNEEATSYLDTTTNRTLASSRFISEALGAEVDWDQAAKTVTISKGSKTIVYTVGSKDVLVNGEKSDYELDQAVVIKDNRTYIPLRASAELLDGKVLWYSGEVVINY